MIVLIRFTSLRHTIFGTKYSIKYKDYNPLIITLMSLLPNNNRTIQVKVQSSSHDMFDDPSVLYHKQYFEQLLDKTLKKER